MSRSGLDKLKNAATYFEKGGLILRAIECYEQLGEWELLLHCLNRGQKQFGDSERLALINKYVPIALNYIYKQYGTDVGLGQTSDTKNLGQRVEEKIREKYKVDDAIQEEELDEYGQELDLSFESENEQSEEENQEEIKDTDDKEE